jgi:hypothetical protein
VSEGNEKMEVSELNINRNLLKFILLLKGMMTAGAALASKETKVMNNPS